MEFTTAQLLPACAVLFGTESVVGTGFLQGLHEDLLTRAFRRRALETHPDRALTTGLDPIVLTRRFQEVQAARDLLSRYLADRTAWPIRDTPPPAATWKARPASAPPRPHASQGKASASEPPRQAPPRQPTPKQTESFWRGQLPNRRLPLGEFLYYSGHISMQSLIAALCAQRTARPTFGQLAVKWGYLQPGDIGILLARRQPGERMGESALRLGVLTPFERNVILGLQWGKRYPFGRYFTDAGLLTDRELADLVRAHHGHNVRWGARRAN